MSDDARRFAPATARNRQPILEVLQRVLPAEGTVLEVASGTGEHAAFFTPRLPEGLRWQPTEAESEALAGIDAHARESGCARILPAVRLDAAAEDWPVDEAAAVFCCNMIHIAPWAAAEGLFAGAGRLLPPGAPLVLYGPFKREGQHTAPSNEAFDKSLHERDSRWGVRCLDEDVTPLAARTGFELDEIALMPANNLTLVFRKGVTGRRGG